MNYELILVPPSRLILFLTLQVVNQTLSQLQHHLLWHQQSLVVTMRIDRSQEMGHLALVNLLHVQVVGKVIGTVSADEIPDAEDSAILKELLSEELYAFEREDGIPL